MLPILYFLRDYGELSLLAAHFMLLSSGLYLKHAKNISFT